MSRSGAVEINGASIAYDVAGTGPAVVLVHAGICDRTMWDDIYDQLSADFQVVRYDCRGFGQSRVSADVPYANAADLIGVMDHLGIERAALVGVSRGGSIVLAATLDHPDRVRAVVPVAAGLPGFEVEPTPDEAEAFDELDRLEEAGDVAALVEADLRVWVDGIGQPPDRVAKSVRDRVRAMDEAIYRDHADDPTDQVILSSPPAAQRLEEIRVPMLVVVGALDTPDTVTTARHLAATVSGARLEVMPDVTHLPSMERPEDFLGRLRPFLAALPE